MSLLGNSARRIRNEDLTVDSTLHPEWVSGQAQCPKPGEQVFCAAGLAEVVKVLGKTGDGSRLLELKLTEGATAPFFVAASNILCEPRPEPEPVVVPKAVRSRSRKTA